MPYDEELAQRIRELVATEPGLTEKRMFGTKRAARRLGGARRVLRALAARQG